MPHGVLPGRAGRLLGEVAVYLWMERSTGLLPSHHTLSLLQGKSKELLPKLIMMERRSFKTYQAFFVHDFIVWKTVENAVYRIFFFAAVLILMLCNE